MPDSSEDNVSCRICMDPKDNYVSLFSHDLSKKVMELADVQVEKDDGLPDTICTECESDLEKCYEFRIKVQVADKKFRKNIKFSQVDIEECNIKEERDIDDRSSENIDDRDSVSMDEEHCYDEPDIQKNKVEPEEAKPDPLDHVVVVEEKRRKVEMSGDPSNQDEAMIEEPQVKKTEEPAPDPLLQVCMKEEEEAEIMDVDNNQTDPFGPSSSCPISICRMSDNVDDTDILTFLEVCTTSEPDEINIGTSGSGSISMDSNDGTDVNLDLTVSESSMSESEYNHGYEEKLQQWLKNEVSLNEKYKKLKTKTNKDQMEKEEVDKWKMYKGNQQKINFVGSSQFHFDLPRTAEPIDYFSVYLNNDILQLMVDETNRNAAETLHKTQPQYSSRLGKWRKTNVEEMKKFLGLVMYMGLVPMPRLTGYWSNKILYKNLVVNRVMKWNQFKLLLRFWLFNNENIDREGDLGKILPLVSHLNRLFKRKKAPGEDLVVNESVIPFRGCLIFRQHLTNKTSQYGIKICKACDATGYTLKVNVYMGKGTDAQDGSTQATSVVMDLVGDYLDKGHTLYIDKSYMSLDLANMLLARNTHLVGTVNRKCLWFPHNKTIPPKQSLEPGEINCLEHPNGIVYTRWCDKREVRIMSTKHPVDFVDTGNKTRQGKPILKPLVVVEYNKAKTGPDLPNQMYPYSTAIRKSMRWYHKVADELLLGTAVENAWLAYKEAVGTMGQDRKTYTYSITTFREKIVYSLLGLQGEVVPPVQLTGHHYLSESVTFTGKGKNKRRTRKCCKVCYQKAINQGDRLTAKNLKKVTTFCEICPQKPYICKECFKKIHK